MVYRTMGEFKIMVGEEQMISMIAAAVPSCARPNCASPAASSARHDPHECKIRAAKEEGEEHYHPPPPRCMKA